MSAPARPRRGLRRKMILPAVVLFVGFAAAAVIGFTTESRLTLEARVDSELGHDAALFERTVAEHRERLALHARFLADMVDLSERFPEPRQSQSILIYLLDYLGQQRIATHLHRLSGEDGGRHEALVRQARLGVRATSVLVDRDTALPRLLVAGVSPVERIGGIEQVVVSELPLDRAFLVSLRPKMSCDVTLILDGAPVASTLDDPACADAVAAAVRDPGPSGAMTTSCGGVPYRVVGGVLGAGGGGPAYALSSSMGSLFAARETIVRNTALGAAAALALAVLVYSWIVRRVTEPLATLSTAARRVADGDLDVELHATSPDEVGELSETFTEMVGRLRSSRDRIDEYHRRELEHADRLATVGELAAGVAHEIRNPLAGIAGAIELLRRDLRELDGKGEILDEVQSQIARMNKLTTDLLAFSRPGEPSPTAYCIHRALDDALFLLQSGRRGAKVEVRKRYDPALPTVWVDPQQIQQVLLNVLLNASQAMPEGGTIDIRTGVERDGESGMRVAVEIVDDGPGVPGDVLETAVRPFVTTKPRGTGLGLAIATRILDAHGGSLAIDNAEGGGARVVIRLPAHAGGAIERSAS